jgi:UDP-N-acetylmuramoylalanine--D-glutamate ligase
MATTLIVGFGVTNQAVARALIAHGEGDDIVVTDDAPSAGARDAAHELGLTLIERPDPARYEALVGAAAMVLPAPGLGDAHATIGLAREAGVPVRSEFDLAARWDDRPLLAITGTDGKTTVTTLTTEMLESSGLRAAAVGNTDVPLVAAIDDPSVDVFVVEASSFRLDHSEHFAPHVATWLNFAPDHLNLHRSVAAYEAAKARIWRDQSADDIAIGNADDPVVAGHLEHATAEHVTFGGKPDADFHLDGTTLVTGAGDAVADTDELWRAFPHDVANALAASATALAGGATVAGCHDALVHFRGLPHRIALIGEQNDVRWYDDSKSTTPNATLAALRSFDSVVLIAGGESKGVDLGVLASEAARVRSVVAIGDAAHEIEDAFAGVRPVVVAPSMRDAVERASSLAQRGDAVLLSPACASFDWYRSYAERGDDFINAVREHIGGAQ